VNHKTNYRIKGKVSFEELNQSEGEGQREEKEGGICFPFV
jgi:hypothetical protein